MINDHNKLIKQVPDLHYYCCMFNSRNKARQKKGGRKGTLK